MGALYRAHRTGRWRKSTTLVDAYLIHLDPPLGHAGHYAGVCEPGRVEERLAEHRAGAGSRLTQAAVRAGSELVLARTWAGVERAYETTLKSYGLRKRCPVCREKRSR